MNRSILSIICMISLSALLGCSNPGLPRGELVGKLTTKGEPLNGGLITVRPIDIKGNSEDVSTEIGDGGEFRFVGLPSGEYQVQIATAYLNKILRPGGITAGKPQGSEKGTGKITKEKHPQVPTMYETFATSKLKVTVHEGITKFDYDCK